MEKWMIVYLLPLEVWMDFFCFPWISRKEFGQLVDRIGNFKFAEHAQFYLHEWGKHKLGGKLYFNLYGLHKQVYNHEHNWYDYVYLEIPQTAVPENIKSCGRIEICHFNAKILDFFDKIKPLLTGVNITLSDAYHGDCLRNLGITMAKLVPLLDGAHSLDCPESTLPVVRECFSFLHNHLAQLKVLKITFVFETAIQYKDIFLITDWLTQPEHANNTVVGPRLCELYLQRENNGLYGEICATIHEQFLAAKTPRTFAVHFFKNYWEDQVADEFHLENSIGEELHGVQTMWAFRITRHRANGEQELQEWIKETKIGMHRGGSILIDNPGTYEPQPAAIAELYARRQMLDEQREREQQAQQHMRRSAITRIRRSLGIPLRFLRHLTKPIFDNFTGCIL